MKEVLWKCSNIHITIHFCLICTYKLHACFLVQQSVGNLPFYQKILLGAAGGESYDIHVCVDA